MDEPDINDTLDHTDISDTTESRDSPNKVGSRDSPNKAVGSGEVLTDSSSDEAPVGMSWVSNKVDFIVGIIMTSHPMLSFKSHLQFQVNS